jgi:hypothetical protein
MEGGNMCDFVSDVAMVALFVVFLVGTYFGWF